jgi:hypothetical protein
MHRYRLSGCLLLGAIFLWCASCHRFAKTYLMVDMIDGYQLSNVKLVNLQIYLAAKLVLQGFNGTIDSKIGDHHELIVRGKDVVDRVTFPEGSQGRIMSVEPKYKKPVDTLMKLFRVDNPVTLWVSFEKDNSNRLPFRSDEYGYFVLVEIKPGSNTVQYGSGAYEIIEGYPGIRLMYDLDKKIDKETRKRQVEQNEFEAR